MLLVENSKAVNTDNDTEVHYEVEVQTSIIYITRMVHD